MTGQKTSIDLLAKETFETITQIGEYSTKIEDTQKIQEVTHSKLEDRLDYIKDRIPVLLQFNGYEKISDGTHYFIRHNDFDSISNIVRYDDTSFMLARINEDDTDDFFEYERRNRMSESSKALLAKTAVYGLPTAFGVIYGILAVNNIAPRMGEGSTPAWDFGYHCFVGFVFSLIPSSIALVSLARKFDKKHEEREAKYGPDIYQDNWQEGSYNALEKALTPLTL